MAPVQSSGYADVSSLSYAAFAPSGGSSPGGSYVISFNARIGAVTLQSSDVTGALGYTPYSNANPNGYLTAATLPHATSSTIGAVKPDGITTVVASDGTISSLGGGGGGGVVSFNTRQGVVALQSLDVTNALGYSPVQTVATRTGNVTLLHTDITDWNTAPPAGGGTGVAPPSTGNTSLVAPATTDSLLTYSVSAGQVLWLPITTGSDGIGDLAAAAPVTATTLFWSSQGGAADVATSGQQVADFVRGQSLGTVPLTADTTLNFALHNGRGLYATVAGITISAPQGAAALADGFAADLTALPGVGSTITLGASLTLLPGVTSTVAHGTYLRIRASTAAGTGTVVYVSAGGSAAVSTAPNTPTGLVLATHSTSALQVTWTAPTGPVPTSYSLNYQVSGAGSWNSITGIGVTNYQITGLTSSTSYAIEVAAVNAGGTSPFTSPLVVSTDSSLTAPGVPTSFVSSGKTNTTLSVTWGPPATGGTVSTYDLSYVPHAGGSTTTVHLAGSIFTYTYPGLTAATGYDLSITATNSAGTSSAATLSNVTTANLPAQVTGLTAPSSTGSSVTLSWSVASGATSYHIQYRTDPAGTWQDVGTEPVSTSIIVGGLTSATTYDFQVAGKNTDGIGPYSSIVAAATTTPPSATVTAPSGTVMAEVACSGVIVTFANISQVYAVCWDGTTEQGSRIAVATSGTTVAGLIFPAAVGTAVATIRVFDASTSGNLLAESPSFIVVPFSATQVFTTAGTTTWFPPTIGTPGYAPAGTQVTFETWGAGSGGNGNGGGGGAYAKVVWALTNNDVTNGVVFNIGAGSAGVAFGVAGVAGGDTTVTSSSTIICKAQGGHAAPAANNVTTGGLATSSTGSTKFSGGTGAQQTSGAGGGGAAGKDGVGKPGAGVGGAGDNGLGGAGGTSTPAGGAGGANVEGGGGGGRSNNISIQGGLGGAPGGGGGGCNVSGGTGNNGADGQVRLSYTPTP